MSLREDIQLPEWYKPENHMFDIIGLKHNKYTVELQPADAWHGNGDLLYWIYPKNGDKPISSYEIWIGENGIVSRSEYMGNHNLDDMIIFMKRIFSKIGIKQEQVPVTFMNRDRYKNTL